MNPGGRAAGGAVHTMAVRRKQSVARAAMACARDTAAAGGAKRKGATGALQVPVCCAMHTEAAGGVKRKGAARAPRAPLSCASDTAAAGVARSKGATRAR